MTIEELLKALKLGEDQDLEFKAAQGGLPRSIWETVSAFANTAGGTIVLGVTEQDDKFEIVGINKPNISIKEFWSIHNNSQKLNYPICRDSDVTTLTIEKKTVICIQIPQASRRQRPIYINGNPIGGTCKRNYEGDYRCTESEVRQMLRDAGEDPSDGQILEGFTVARHLRTFAQHLRTFARHLRTFVRGTRAHTVADSLTCSNRRQKST